MLYVCVCDVTRCSSCQKLQLKTLAAIKKDKKRETQCWCLWVKQWYVCTDTHIYLRLYKTIHLSLCVCVQQPQGHFHLHLLQFCCISVSISVSFSLFVSFFPFFFVYSGKVARPLGAGPWGYGFGQGAWSPPRHNVASNEQNWNEIHFPRLEVHIIVSFIATRSQANEVVTVTLFCKPTWSYYNLRTTMSANLVTL